MGGKALKNTFTERKNTEEFLRIGKEIQYKVYNDIAVETVMVKCYYTKADHGDLDLLIKLTPLLNIDWRKYIQDTFNPNEIIKNDKVYSFDYQEFQIDFILINEVSWNIAQTYYNFDCVGNIMGKTYHKFGLSYGWEGLFYKFRNFNGSNSADILLTNDARKIFEFGGYDYDRYLLGFNTLEEIFRFCINSKYFDAEMFKFENLKSIDKKRNRKRGSYHLFLDFIQKNNINTSYPFNKDKDTYINTIDDAFPDALLVSRLYDLGLEDQRNREIAEKFNGNVVMEWIPELSGKELGAAIGKFKSTFIDDRDYKDYILDAGIDEIKSKFMKSYNNG